MVYVKLSDPKLDSDSGGHVDDGGDSNFAFGYFKNNEISTNYFIDT